MPAIPVDDDTMDGYNDPGDPGGSSDGRNGAAGGGDGGGGGIIVTHGTSGWASVDVNNLGSAEIFLYFATAPDPTPTPQVVIGAGQSYTLTPTLCTLADCYFFIESKEPTRLGLVWKNSSGQIIPQP